MCYRRKKDALLYNIVLDGAVAWSGILSWGGVNFLKYNIIDKDYELKLKWYVRRKYIYIICQEPVSGREGWPRITFSSITVLAIEI